MDQDHRFPPKFGRYCPWGQAVLKTVGDRKVRSSILLPSANFVGLAERTIAAGCNPAPKGTVVRIHHPTPNGRVLMVRCRSPKPCDVGSNPTACAIFFYFPVDRDQGTYYVGLVRGEDDGYFFWIETANRYRSFPNIEKLFYRVA